MVVLLDLIGDMHHLFIFKVNEMGMAQIKANVLIQSRRGIINKYVKLNKNENSFNIKTFFVGMLGVDLRKILMVIFSKILAESS